MGSIQVMTPNAKLGVHTHMHMPPLTGVHTESHIVTQIQLSQWLLNLSMAHYSKTCILFCITCVSHCVHTLVKIQTSQDNLGDMIYLIFYSTLEKYQVNATRT